MSHARQKSLYGAAVTLALALLGSRPLAAQPTVTFNLTNVGQGAPTLDLIYTSPYTGTINGGPTTSVICDDFADDSFIPEEWTAYATSLSSLSSTVDNTLKWGTSATGTSNNVSGTDPLGSWSLTQTQAYDVAALLSVDILQSVQGSQVQKDYSYALWALFDPTGTQSNPGAFTWLSNFGSTTDENNAETYLKAAINAITTGTANLSNYNVTIYSYDPNGMTALCGTPLASCSAGGYSLPPQEFITVTTPEASTPVLFAVDLLGFVALVGFLRKRVSRSI